MNKAKWVVVSLSVLAVWGMFVATAGLSRKSAPAREAPRAAMGELFGAEGDEVGPGGGEFKDERKVSKMMEQSPAPVMAGPRGGAIGIGGIGTAKSSPKRAKGGAQEQSELPRSEDGAQEAAPTRAWFPETFLFEPLVVTDATGRATVPVRVPDRLTRWRVLALAHSRSGDQAGAVSSFAGTLPTYVDAVTPAFLMAGDRVRLPIQLVNTTEADVSQDFRVEARGAELSAAGGAVRVPAAGSLVQYVNLKVDSPGTAVVRASLGAADAVERSIEVLPVGRPLSQSRGGTLAAPRQLALEGPAESIPGSERVRLLVFPGALAVLRAELSASLSRGGVADDGYSLLLAGRAATLLRSLGEEPDPKAIRELTLVAAQRSIRHARSPDVSTATLLAEAALAHPDNPVLSRLGERLAATVASKQRPDGTCEGGNGWTLQRLLVTTADCTRAVRASGGSPAARQRASGASARAAGAFERNVERVEDGFTAAAILASGAVSGTLQERLKAKVLEALVTRDDGSKVLPVGPGVVRGDGLVPGEAEATALAVLALEGDPKAPLADLGTSLLGGYSPAYGWGDGRANLACMRAVLTLFKEPVPPNVQIVLERDGQPITSGVLDPSKLKQVLALEADAAGSAGLHTWEVRAQPPVPGLGFSLTLQAYVPWKKEAAQGGLELAISGPREGRVGTPMPVTLSATAPSGMALEIRHSLPAGVQADVASLQALVQAGTLSGFRTEDGAVKLEVPPRAPGQPFGASYRVVPTLAGTLHGSASTVSAPGRADLSYAVPPEVWLIR